MIYWIFLTSAIVTEVIGTLSMKYSSVSGDMTGLLVMYFMIASSYILLAMAVKKVALGVAYALWEGIGVIFITAFSVLLFNESLPPMKLIGLALLIVGIALIKSGTKKTSTLHSIKQGKNYAKKAIK